MPRFTKDEFDPFLECGILAHGFLLQVVQRVVSRHLSVGASSSPTKATAVLSLIQRFGSAANFNIHLHCLVLGPVYRWGADGVPAFVESWACTDGELHALLETVIISS